VLLVYFLHRDNIENKGNNMDLLESINENEVLKLQFEHRLNLISSWNIAKDARILEIGCGQGETTLAIACHVGERGFVHGIDKASPNYGGPVTLSEAREKILNLPVGKYIQIDLDVDILSQNGLSLEKPFNYIIFSHCSWYFNSPKEFKEVIEKVKNFGKTICLAEWDMRITNIDQIGHYNAALIQGQYNAYHQDIDSNIRTLFSYNDIINILTDEGWRVNRKASMDSSNLQDGIWEINNVLLEYPNKIISSSAIPDGIKFLLLSEIELLKEYKKIT
jgi:hypothetical protein